MEKITGNSTVFASVFTPRGHFVNEISNQLTVRLCEKLYCNWVTLATPISSHVKDKDSIFTARGEDMIF